MSRQEGHHAKALAWVSCERGGQARFNASKIHEANFTQAVFNAEASRRTAAYLRIYLYWLQRGLLKRLDRRGDHVGLYLHPWEAAPITCASICRSA